MTPDPDGVLFVGRSGQNQGVSGRVKRIGAVEPYAAGLITVALGGASRLATFVQQEAFYTAQNVAVLTPLRPMGLEEKFFWATCIRANRFRYEGFGREANRTLHLLELPNSPDTTRVHGSKTVAVLAKRLPVVSGLETNEDKPGGTVGDLFDIRYGHSLELNALRQTARPRGVNFVSRTDRRNGVSARVDLPPATTPASAGELSVALGGSPLATFLQAEPFVCGRDVAILTAKTPMTDAEKLFWAMCIRANRYRFSYGRQANRTLHQLQLPPLPANFGSRTTVGNVINSVKASFDETSAALSRD